MTLWKPLVLHTMERFRVSTLAPVLKFLLKDRRYITRRITKTNHWVLTSIPFSVMTKHKIHQPLCVIWKNWSSVWAMMGYWRWVLVVCWGWVMAAQNSIVLQVRVVYFLLLLASSHGLVINPTILCAGHRKSIVDMVNRVDKNTILCQTMRHQFKL